MTNRVLYTMVVIFFLMSISMGFAQEVLPVPSSADDALDEELRYLQAETYVITASRIPENIKKTASSITVITDRQIRQMGAKHLADVIQTVPGMNVHYDSSGAFLFGVRGDMREDQNVILVMVNGHPLNENSTGSATYTHDTMSLDNVKRIEVIRGPGSALYGANAFEGVINIITKEAEDIDGWELTAGGGSYDTQQYNLLYGKTFNDLDIAFNYNYFNTHGFNKHVDEDYLSTSNRIQYNIASLAPKRIKRDDEKYDVSLNLKYKGLVFDGKYVDREEDLPVSVANAMANRNKFIDNAYFVTISYGKTLWEDLDLSGKVYRNHNRTRADYQILPPSVAWLPYGPSFAKDGEIAVISRKNNRTGFELLATYRMGDANTIVAGTTYEEMKQYDVNWRSNFLYSPFTGGIIPLPSVRERSNIQNHNRSVKRNFKAFFVEDIWDITDDLRLTLGVRWDDYSDFGSEVSPRVGLTWEFKKGYDLKLLYGHAFRVPNFQELYNRKAGNPDLDAETIDTYEISLGAEFTSSLSGRVTFYHNEGDDIVDQFSENIDFAKYTNHSKMRSQGIEVEARYDLGRGSYLALNYTYQRWMSPHTKERNWWAPKHLGNVMANIRLSKYLNFFAACHIEDGFRRDRGDTRDDMSGFAVVNTTLIAKKFLKGYEGLELRGSVYNLFDKDYTNPEVPALPNDMPQPGRNFIVEVKYKF